MPDEERETTGTLSRSSQEAEASPAPSRPGARHRKRKARTPLGRAAPWLITVMAAVLLAVLLRLFVVQTFFVPSSSMMPTLLPGDRMLVLKLGYSLQEGAVVVFKTPPSFQPADCGGAPENDFVKRVIGLPGQTIWSVGNSVYVNGKPLAEPYLPQGQPLGTPIRRQKVPANDYFVMGDNRPVSCDSRIWGVVPRRDIIGRVVAVIWRNGHPAFDII